MTEREAGRLSNRIYAAIAAKQLTRRKGLEMLEKIQHNLSTTQFCRFMDLQDACRYNPWMLDE